MDRDITFEEFIPIAKKELNEAVTPFNKTWVQLKYSRGKNIKYDNTRTESYNEMVKLYEMYTGYMFGRDWACTNYYFYINELTEGLTMSSHITDTVNILKRSIPNTIEYNIDEMIGYNNTAVIGIEMFEDDYNIYKTKIKQALNVCGYYIAKVSNVINGADKIIYLEIEPKYQFDCTDYIYDHTDKILYHITLGSIYNKIKNNGLIPKAHNKIAQHPERIYMLEPGNYNPILFKEHAKRLYKSNGMFSDYAKKYLKNNKLDIVVLKIDLNKDTDYKYRFFKDPNYNNAVFMYNSINPKCVDILYNFSI